MLAIWKLKRYLGSAACITRINQSVDKFSYMGGAYNVQYTYDDQYRLTRAVQSSSQLGGYDYSMSYSPSGLVATKNCSEIGANITYGYQYSSNNRISSFASHRVATLFPTNTEEVALTVWNANGELTSIVQPFQDNFRRHLWNEAGQLSLFVSNEYCGYYAYDAQGNRAYKLTGTVVADQYDAGTMQATAYFDDVTLYVNPYMVVTPRGYTKHYYNGSERIAARLGDYWYNASTMGVGHEKVDLAREVLEDRLNSGNTDEEYFEEEYYYSEEVGDIRCEPYTLRTTYSSCTYVEDMLYSVFDGGACMADGMYGIDKGIFYYHSDHLGSASWITDDQGGVVQYIHYMPYGELWVNQQACQYDERFKFTGKERDTETGYDYFGARYYSPMLGHWLSVDKLADDYPHITPYAQSAWNPIKYKDPDGRYIIIANGDESVLYDSQITYDGENNYIQSVYDNLNQLRQDDPEVAEMIDEMAENDFYNTISMGDKNIGNYCRTSKQGDVPQSGQIGYDPENQETVRGDQRTPRVGLAHELQHLSDANKGTLDNTEVVPGVPQKEINAINTENKIRKVTGDEKRTSYKGHEIPSNKLTSY